MSGVIGNTIEVNVWARSVIENGDWVDNSSAEPAVLPQGLWLLVWNLNNLFQGNWTTPRNPNPPEWRQLFFHPRHGITFDQGLPEGVEIVEGPEPPEQENVTQWMVAFQVKTGVATSFSYTVNLIDRGGDVLESLFQRFDPTILVETDPVST
jgi:hypothetical protein